MVENAVLRARFGSRVQTLLARAGKSSADLAASSKLRPDRIEKILDGSYVRITINDMEIIASVLGAPLYTLLAPPET